MHFFVFLWLTAIGCVLARDEIEATYRGKISLFRPYVDRISGRLSFGDLNGGCTVVSSGSDSGVHLTSSSEGSSGSIIGKNPIDMKNWKIDIHLRIKEGAQGIGLWIMKDFSEGDIFGGNSSFNGLLVFLALDKNSLSKEYPSIGVATAYGGSPVVHFERKVKYLEDTVISLSLWKGTLSVMYGGRGKKLEIVDELKRVVIDEGSYLSVSGKIDKSYGDITVKTISFYKQHTMKKDKKFNQDIPKTRSFMTWIVLAVLIGGVGYYIYTQKNIRPRNKGILQQ